MPFCTKLTATGKAIYLVFHHFPFSHWERIQQNVIGWHDHPILAKSAGGLNIICQFNQMEKSKSHPQRIFNPEVREIIMYILDWVSPKFKLKSIWRVRGFDRKL